MFPRLCGCLQGFVDVNLTKWLRRPHSSFALPLRPHRLLRHRFRPRIPIASIVYHHWQSCCLKSRPARLCTSHLLWLPLVGQRLRAVFAMCRATPAHRMSIRARGVHEQRACKRSACVLAENANSGTISPKRSCVHVVPPEQLQPAWQSLAELVGFPSSAASDEVRTMDVINHYINESFSVHRHADDTAPRIAAATQPDIAAYDVLHFLPDQLTCTDVQSLLAVSLCVV